MPVRPHDTLGMIDNRWHIKHWSHELTFKRPAGTSRGVMLSKPAYFIEVTCEGFKGQGECGLLPGLSIDDSPQYPLQLAEFCQAIDTLGAEQWLAWADSGQISSNFLHAWRLWPSMVFALEQTLLSFVDSRNGGSGQQLFNNPFSQRSKGIPINGLIWMGDADHMTQEAEARLSEGFTCLKMKVGAIDFQQEMAQLTLLRRRFSSHELELRVDANGAFTKANAAEAMDALLTLDLHSIEQPSAPTDIDLLAELSANHDLPIALDESLIGRHDSRTRDALLDAVKPAYIVLKPSLVGGFTSAEDWIHRASKRGIAYWVTSALESSMGLNAIAQWAAQLEGLSGYQGLGTGSIYQNNLPSLTKVKSGELWQR